MLKNYFRIAWRNMLKNKTSSIINIFGLTLGFTICLLIGLFIKHEFSYDGYHKNSSRIHRLATYVEGSTYSQGIAKVGGPWAEAAKQSIPEIEDYTRFMNYGEALVKQGSEHFYESGGFFADASVFKVFSWKLLSGDARTALRDPNSIVLTESLAKKYFSNINPIGQTLNLDNQPVYKVTGVVQDPPANSHFNFTFFISSSTYKDDDRLDWQMNHFYTYLLLKPGVSAEVVNKKIKAVLEANMDKESASVFTPFLQPLESIHLHSNLWREITPNSDMGTIYIFEVVALFILIIACMNFINLTTANAAGRAKEVGIRKANGAQKGSLISQFLLESLFIGIVAAIFTCLLTYIALEPFGKLLNRPLELNISENAALFLGFIAVFLLISILSSIYPAFVLSSFKPVKVLKGDYSFKTRTGLRKGLVVFQFMLSVALIIAVLVIGTQMNYMRKKDLGFDKDQVITVPLRNHQSSAEIENIRQRLTSIKGIVSISASSNQPGGGDWGIPYEAVGLSKDQQPSMRCLVIDENFLETYDIKLAAGRGFSKSFSTDTAAYIINETAARKLGWKDPVNQHLSMPAIARGPGPIIGVVKDFHYHSLHETIEPLFLFIKRDWFSQLNIKIDELHTESVLSELKNQWTTIEPQYPFKYSFLDERFEAFYDAEKRTSALLIWFTVIAIMISCLGLYAISALAARQRTKEIGIRKVLGASVAGIVVLLSKDYLKLVVISLVLAAPLSWFFMNKWLEDFSYRITISWWLFVIATIAAIVIAFLTVSFQSIKAAVTNPIKNLRTE